MKLQHFSKKRLQARIKCVLSYLHVLQKWFWLPALRLVKMVHIKEWCNAQWTLKIPTSNVFATKAENYAFWNFFRVDGACRVDWGPWWMMKKIFKKIILVLFQPQMCVWVVSRLPQTLKLFFFWNFFVIHLGPHRRDGHHLLEKIFKKRRF